MGEVGALAQTCRRMASILVWDGYGRDLHMALQGVVENVQRKRWRAAKYAVARGWYEGGEEGLWREVAEVVGGEEKMVLGGEEDLRGWENVVMAALSLPGASGCVREWPAVYCRRKVRRSLVYVAAFVGSERVLDWAMERGGKLEWSTRNRWIETPLFVACKAGSLEVVARLVEGGADVTVRNQLAKNILHAACQGGDVGVVRYVLRLGVVDVDDADCDGDTPLCDACGHGHLDVARLLVEEEGAGVDVEGINSYGPLFWACRSGNTEIVRMLIDLGAGSGVGKDAGVWLEGLLSAAHLGCAGVIRELVRVGVGVDESDAFGKSALCLASRAGHVESVRVLVEEGGADVNKLGSRGRAPLYLAEKAGKEDVVRVLLELGADPTLIADEMYEKGALRWVCG